MIYFEDAKEEPELLEDRIDFCEQLKRSVDRATFIAGDVDFNFYRRRMWVEGVESEVYFTITSLGGSVVAYVVLKIRKGWKARETKMIFVRPQWRKRGLAVKLYDQIFKQGVIVISGWSHNPRSRKLWTKLASNKKLNTWAQDLRDLARTSPVQVENGKIQSDLQLYRRSRAREDVRLIAYNPRYA